ncbi:hypothetical protein [Aeromicrobium sp. UC242_57]|uniref:hypothetical protein n=1 Tax=Aeromicrobium sp. UC242_57 TaxID=3374624 RepID=UPI003798BC4B
MSAHQLDGFSAVACFGDDRQAGSSSRISRTPRRTRAWSSASRMRMSACRCHGVITAIGTTRRTSVPPPTRVRVTRVPPTISGALAHALYAGSLAIPAEAATVVGDHQHAQHRPASTTTR